MNELQSIRRAYEGPIETALAALSPPITVYTDNRFYDENDADSEFALCRVSFGNLTEVSIGPTGDGELIQGMLIVELFTPKGAGPGRSQEAAQAVWGALEPLNRVLPKETDLVARLGRLQGPRFSPLEGRPHYMASFAASIRARVPSAVVEGPLP